MTMPDATTAHEAPHAADAAESRLHGSAYLALRNVTCECHGGVLTLRGRLPSYHLKQVAQALVAGMEGVRRVENLIEVVPPAPRHT
jgi:osmotically-inducible protein OsmY